MCKSIVLVFVLCFLQCQFKNIRSENDTFENVTVEWCADSSETECENTTILHSNTLGGHTPSNHADYSYVFISHQHVPSIYENAISHMHIKSLEVNSCGTEEIEIGAFNNVTIIRLTITKNELTKINKGIFRDVVIGDTLDLSLNKLTVIEEGTFEFLVLTTLDLSGNQFEEVNPGTFKGLNTNFISLVGNKIKSVDTGSFRDVKELQLLDLSDNLIQKIAPGAFESMVEPAFLYIQNNLLDTIHEGIFNDKTYMELLLSGNKIDNIEVGAFIGSGIGYLNISNNELVAIKNGVFNNRSEMNYLTLSDNKIQTIEPRALDNVGMGVELDGNDLRILKKDTLKYVRIIALLRNKKLKTIEEGAFNDQNIMFKKFYDDKSRALYLEKDNILDAKSRNYIFTLVKSKKFVWYGKIDGPIFPSPF